MSSAPNSPRPRPNPAAAALLAAGYARVMSAAELGGSFAELRQPAPVQTTPTAPGPAVPFGDNDGPL